LQLYCFWFLLIAQRLGSSARLEAAVACDRSRRQRPREAVKAKPAILGESVRSDPALGREPSQGRTPSRDRGPVLGAPRAVEDSTCLRRDKSTIVLTDGAGNPPQRVSQVGGGLI
jgi:hypothetical protein